jgi:hypothetical protein
MTRLFTLGILALTAISSFALYQLSYDVKRLEDELAEINRAIAQDRENMLVLHAEWSYLTRPDVLQERAAKLLDLKPTAPKQIVTAAEVPTLQERVKVQPQPPVLSSTKKPNPAPVRPAAMPVASLGTTAGQGPVAR